MYLGASAITGTRETRQTNATGASSFAFNHIGHGVQQRVQAYKSWSWSRAATLVIFANAIRVSFSMTVSP